MAHCLPGIIAFLGYNPLPEGDDLIGKLKRLRGTLGLTQETLAQKLGIDESTIAGWERGENKPTNPYRKLIEDLVNSGRWPDARAGGSSEAGFSPRRLIIARHSLGLSQTALAKKLGISWHTLWRWERGDRKPHALYRKLVANLIRESTLSPAINAETVLKRP
jgi:DNA-binding transcriptional regulator YiaG